MNLIVNTGPDIFTNMCLMDYRWYLDDYWQSSDPRYSQIPSFQIAFLWIVAFETTYASSVESDNNTITCF